MSLGNETPDDVLKVSYLIGLFDRCYFWKFSYGLNH